MDARSALLHLEAWARDELEAQRRLEGAFQAQEEALVRRDLEGLQRATEELAREGEGVPERAGRRERALAALAAGLGIPARHVTFAALAERLGEPARRLSELRAELRTAVAAVARRARRVRRAIAVHGELNRELFTLVLGSEDGERGRLVDAEA